MSIVSFQEFQRLDMRIGLVTSASRVEGTENLIKMAVDLGGEVRQAVAGLAKWYKPEQLVGKKFAFVVNLKPAKLRGVESNCMILAADDGKGKVVLLRPEEDIDIGSKVR